MKRASHFDLIADDARIAESSVDDSQMSVKGAYTVHGMKGNDVRRPAIHVGWARSVFFVISRFLAARSLSFGLVIDLVSSVAAAIMHALSRMACMQPTTLVSVFSLHLFLSSAVLLSFHFPALRSRLAPKEQTKTLSHSTEHLSSSCFQFSLYYSIHCVHNCIVFTMHRGLSECTQRCCFGCCECIAVHVSHDGRTKINLL